MIVETPGMLHFYDDPAFQQACMVATNRANRYDAQHRIYRGINGRYMVADASNVFYGLHVAFVNPDHSYDTNYHAD